MMLKKCLATVFACILVCNSIDSTVYISEPMHYIPWGALWKNKKMDFGRYMGSCGSSNLYFLNPYMDKILSYSIRIHIFNSVISWPVYCAMYHFGSICDWPCVRSPWAEPLTHGRKTEFARWFRAFWTLNTPACPRVWMRGAFWLCCTKFGGDFVKNKHWQQRERCGII